MRRASRLLLGTCLWALACTGDHDRLAKTDAAGSGGAGGDGGSTPGSGAATGSGGATVTSTGVGGGVEEPAGPTRLTVVDGIVDQPAVRLCFVAYPSGAGASAPWPDPAGLAFAQGAAVGDPSALVPPGTDVQLFVLGGDLTGTAGLGCDAIVGARGASWIARSLGVLPASFFTEPKSLLLVPHGCLGSHADPSAPQACGAGYDPKAPAAGLVAGFLSRLVEIGQVSLQFVHAAPAMVEVELRLRSGPTSVALTVVPSWTLGAITPFPPYTKLSAATFAVATEPTLEVATSTVSQPLDATSFAKAFAASELAPSDVENARGYAFVAVGAAPGFVAPPPFRPYTYTVVRADP
jgi:hypothetical protein